MTPPPAAYLAAVVAAVCLGAAMRALRIVPIVAAAVATTRAAIGRMQHAELSDVEKEQLARQASLRLLRSAFSITGRAAVAVVAALLPLLVFQAFAIVPVHAAVDLLTTAPGIVLSGAAVTLSCWVRMR